MPSLTSLDVNDAPLDWLEEWTDIAANMPTPFQLLQQCTISTLTRKAKHARDIVHFLRSVANSPMQLLDVTLSHTTFDAAAIARLARCHQFCALHLSFTPLPSTAVGDWRGGALFAPLTSRCLSNLGHVSLQHIKMSAASVVAIAAAAPQLHSLNLICVELSCSSAVVCAIVGGYCERIVELSIGHWNSAHVWVNVRAADIVSAYQLAVTAAGRGVQYQPFTQLRELHTVMCWCKTPSVWHALLLLLKYAKHIRRLACMMSIDPLVISALAYLPSLRCVSLDCGWPRSVVDFIEQRLERRTSLRRPKHQTPTDRCCSTAAPNHKSRSSSS